MKPSTIECADRRVMEHADRDNDGHGWAQAEVETERGSISPIWLIPFSFSTLLIPQDNNRWLKASNTANLSAFYTHIELSLTDLYTQATVGHINVLLRIAQGQSHIYHNLSSPRRLDVLWFISSPECNNQSEGTSDKNLTELSKAIRCITTFTKLNPP